MNIRNILGLALSSRGGQFFDLTIGGISVTDVQPLGNWLTPGVTKAGRLSFSGIARGEKVKVYSVFSPDQAKLRQAVSEIPFKHFSFPEIICSNDNFVVERWVEGNNSAAAELHKKDSVASIIQELHDATASIEPEWLEDSPFCYFRDYLILRLERWRAVPEVTEFINNWMEIHDSLEQKLPIRLCHPDLTTRNMIQCASSGRMYVIDNELLGLGRGWILDWHNASLSHLAASKVANQSDLSDFLELSWQLRKLGSLLDAYDYQAVQQLLATHTIR